MCVILCIYLCGFWDVPILLSQSEKVSTAQKINMTEAMCLLKKMRWNEWFI